MFKLEAITENPEVDLEIRESIKRQYKTAEALLNDITKRLGEGMTAEVCFLASNDKLCLKIFKKRDEIREDISFVSPAEELFFLEKLRFISFGDVKVPRGYCAFEDIEEDGMKFLLMERLDAISVEDVFKGKAELPESFNFDKFYSALKSFVADMHSCDVYHRDLHEGNIMIDIKTGMPRVIDFGGATEFYGEGNPYEVVRGSVVDKRNADVDETRIKNVCDRLKKLTVVR